MAFKDDGYDEMIKVNKALADLANEHKLDIVDLAKILTFFLNHQILNAEPTTNDGVMKLDAEIVREQCRLMESCIGSMQRALIAYKLEHHALLDPAPEPAKVAH